MRISEGLIIRLQAVLQSRRCLSGEPVGEPQNDGNDKYGAENAANPASCVSIIASVATAPGKQKEDRGDDQKSPHHVFPFSPTCVLPTVGFQVGLCSFDPAAAAQN